MNSPTTSDTPRLLLVSWTLLLLLLLLLLLPHLVILSHCNMIPLQLLLLLLRLRLLFLLVLPVSLHFLRLRLLLLLPPLQHRRRPLPHPFKHDHKHKLKFRFKFPLLLRLHSRLPDRVPISLRREFLLPPSPPHLMLPFSLSDSLVYPLPAPHLRLSAGLCQARHVTPARLPLHGAPPRSLPRMAASAAANSALLLFPLVLCFLAASHRPYLLTLFARP